MASEKLLREKVKKNTDKKGEKTLPCNMETEDVMTLFYDKK